MSTSPDFHQVAMRWLGSISSPPAARSGVLATRAVRDLGVIAFATVAAYALSSSLELSERLMAWLLTPEGEAYGDWPMALLGAVVAVAWYWVRRWREYRAELERRRALEQRLRIAAEDAELANRTKSEFLANMSHELRTPLNAILGFAEALADGHFGPLSQRQREYIRDIHVSGEHLLKIINDILDMSKIDAGRMTLSEDAVDLAAAVESCLRLVRHRADEAGIVIAVEPMPGLPILRADELRVKQIVLNLLSNAVKFTHRGGRVGVRVALQDDGGVLVAISDTGIGMSAAEIKVALTPFAQVENFLTRTNVGTGLGLPIVNALIGLHGGRLQIDSAKGVGTTATVVFPPGRAEWPSRAPMPERRNAVA